MNRFTNRQFPVSGFTLVELLVVISIIGLLAGLSIPAIAAARASAQTAASTANLKQIHTMMTAFLGENNNTYPQARYEAGTDPNGFNDGLAHYWRRAIWEATQGSLGNNYDAQVSALTKGPYRKTMWCPLMAAKHGVSSIGFLEGHGSYSMNMFFHLWGDRPARRSIQENVVGKEEPMIVAGTPQGNIGTYAYFDTTRNPPPANWLGMAYEYGAGRNKGLALFKDGRVEMIDATRGNQLNSKVANNTDFQ
jgi:prepilin-type N-terminal cleavage/methylation domain-containing protein